MALTMSGRLLWAGTLGGLSVALFLMIWRGSQKGGQPGLELELALREFFAGVSSADLDSLFNKQLTKLLRPFLDARLEASINEALTIYGRLLKQFDVPARLMPLSNAALMRRCIVGRPNFLDPPPGFPYVAPTGDASDASLSEPEQRMRALEETMLARAERFLMLSDSIYKGGAEQAGINRRDLVLDCTKKEDTSAPRHAVFVDHLTESICVLVRGTASMRDTITDLVCESVPALDGRGSSHKGIHDATLEMLPQAVEAVTKAAKLYPTYTIVNTGHSLGGGTALLLTLMMRHRRDELEKKLPDGALDDMQCFAFAPPPVWAPLHALDRRDTRNVFSFVHNTDMIPRSSLRALQMLGSAMFYIDQTSITEGQCIHAILGPDNDGLVQKVVAEADEAITKSVQCAEDGSIALLDGKTVRLHDYMYIPGQIFHLYPGETSWSKSALPEPEDPLEPSEETLKPSEQSEVHSTLLTARDGGVRDYSMRGRGDASQQNLSRYRVHEISAQLIADAPILDSDFFAVDHQTTSYIRAFRRLDLPGRRS